MFKFFNANKFGYNIEDCTIRAVSVAEGISWDKAYIKLSDYARKRGLMLNSVTSIESYLDDNYERICEDGVFGKRRAAFCRQPVRDRRSLSDSDR